MEQAVLYTQAAVTGSPAFAGDDTYNPLPCSSVNARRIKIVLPCCDPTHIRKRGEFS
jgi:hypothetical protein